MKLEQKTITTVVADEGKLLVRKTTGAVVGESITLGYDYYDSTGLPLAEKRLATPDDFEEIDKPEDYAEPVVINQAKRLRRIQTILEEEKTEIINRGLTNAESREFIQFFPVFGKDIKEGDTVEAGKRFQYTPDGETEPRLYEVLQSHTILAHYYPSVNTASLYKEVVDESDETLGTLDNPIAYDGNMALENGKYYTQDDVVYLCNRDTGTAVYNALADLVGIYVEAV